MKLGEPAPGPTGPAPVTGSCLSEPIADAGPYLDDVTLRPPQAWTDTNPNLEPGSQGSGVGPARIC